MNQVDLSASGGSGSDSVKVVTRGSVTSMGPNGCNPNPT
jgi:hypothetical protein